MPSPKLVGGSFAPPLTAAKIDAYAALAAAPGVSPEVADGVALLARMARTFLETPASTRPGTPHPSGRGAIVPLEDAEVKRIWDVVPWKHELDGWKVVFGEIDPVKDKSLRDAAHHLLWYGYELTADREPATTDRL